MTKDDIIRMAREAGFEDWAVYGRIESKEECLERFAALVAAAEREACAEQCDWIAAQWETNSKTGLACAAAIRARGNL